MISRDIFPLCVLLKSVRRLWSSNLIEIVSSSATDFLSPVFFVFSYSFRVSFFWRALALYFFDFLVTPPIREVRGRFNFWHVAVCADCDYYMMCMFVYLTIIAFFCLDKCGADLNLG